MSCGVSRVMGESEVQRDDQDTAPTHCIAIKNVGMKYGTSMMVVTLTESLWILR
jgi:hypothetical protein